MDLLYSFEGLKYHEKCAQCYHLKTKFFDYINPMIKLSDVFLYLKYGTSFGQQLSILIKLLRKMQTSAQTDR
jgi:hypothetical protein